METRYLVQTVSTATPENANFAGMVHTYIHGLRETLLFCDGYGYAKINALHPFHILKYGYKRMCDARRSYNYRHPEMSKSWTSTVEILTVKIYDNERFEIIPENGYNEPNKTEGGKSMIITVDSFGADVPENWEDIAAYLNGIIDEQGIDDANELWESFWNGQLDKTPADFGL
jgi:hypothetical protein